MDAISGSPAIWAFSRGMSDTGASVDHLGGKGANLVTMCALDLPVPEGLIVPTDACRAYLASGKRQLPDALWNDIRASLQTLEASSGKRFGRGPAPLLVSVRSGAPVSMPGMMDTVLNLGLTPESADALSAETNDPRFAWDCYRRFVQMFANVVHGLPLKPFEAMLSRAMADAAVERESDLPAEALQQLTSKYKAHFQSTAGQAFPYDPFDQLHAAICAVFDSWHGDRAIAYRRMNNIPDTMGTAVVIQRMVFGNFGVSSASGVLFTRNPSTGGPGPFGEYLINAQGEDVVAGIRTPLALAGDKAPLDKTMPRANAELLKMAQRLEAHLGDMQDIEFTVETGELWLLQTRSGKRSARAAVEIAVALAEEGLLSRDDALMRIRAEDVEACLHPQIAVNTPEEPLCSGLAASPGAASGRVALTSEAAEAFAGQGEPAILVREETSPEDIVGMQAARGILTATGGQTSHAAVVARGMGRPCVSGAADLRLAATGVSIGDTFIAEGDLITVDGTNGRVFAGTLAMTKGEAFPALETLLHWADARRRLGVRANAETEEDAFIARSMGAEGIGLVRTEHMFFSDTGILAMRRMILADTAEDRSAALDDLEPIQRDGLFGVFRAMAGLPVTIRLLDPPLHEFLPRSQRDFEALALAMGHPVATLRNRAAALSELNPMIGHRGCRLAITYPGLVQMQVRAIIDAVGATIAAGESPPILELMVPLVGRPSELAHVRALIEATFAAAGSNHAIPYTVGTMIELPSAALTAGAIARDAAFFSFGTNDLTQTTLGISRDDSGHFMQAYRDREIFAADPFASIDEAAVGQLVTMASIAGRSIRPDLKLGACGEHAGDPASIQFFAQAGLDYVSCSAYRLPVARLAAAQAQIRRDISGQTERKHVA